MLRRPSGGLSALSGYVDAEGRTPRATAGSGVDLLATLAASIDEGVTTGALVPEESTSRPAGFCILFTMWCAARRRLCASMGRLNGQDVVT
jgi:hypothetical protein